MLRDSMVLTFAIPENVDANVDLFFIHKYMCC